MKNRVEIGDEVKDAVTGFRGVVVAYTEWLNGCPRATVQPPIDKDGKHPDALSFDVPQLEIVKKQKVSYMKQMEKSEKETGRTGGPAPYKITRR